MEEKVTWTIVKFINDDSVSAVPTKWIINNECLWPPFTTDKITSAIKNQTLDTCWPSYKIDIFRNGTYDNYETARAKARKAEYTSDLNSDIDEFNKKRRILPKRLSSSSEESEPLDGDLHGSKIIKSPPKLFRHSLFNKGSALKGKTNVFGNQHSRQAHIYQECLDSPSHIPETPTQNNSSDIEISKLQSFPLAKEMQIERPPATNYTSSGELGNILSPSTPVLKQDSLRNRVSASEGTCSCCPHHIHYLKDVIKSQHVIRNMVQDLINENARKNTNMVPETEVVSVFEEIVLPANNEQDLLELNNFLKRDGVFARAVSEVCKIGGKSPYDFAKRSLSFFMTDDLATKYSWLGRRDKEEFQKLELSRLLIAAADQGKLSVTKKETEMAISNWLRRANDRKKNRRIGNSVL